MRLIMFAVGLANTLRPLDNLSPPTNSTVTAPHSACARQRYCCPCLEEKDILDVLGAHNPSTLGESMTCSRAGATAQALAYLTRLGMIHYDVKSALTFFSQLCHCHMSLSPLLIIRFVDSWSIGILLCTHCSFLLFQMECTPICLQESVLVVFQWRKGLLQLYLIIEPEIRL